MNKANQNLYQIITTYHEKKFFIDYDPIGQKVRAIRLQVGDRAVAYGRLAGQSQEDRTFMRQKSSATPPNGTRRNGRFITKTTPSSGYAPHTETISGRQTLFMTSSAMGAAIRYGRY